MKKEQRKEEKRKRKREREIERERNGRGTGTIAEARGKKGRARSEERNCDWQKSWWNDSRRKRTVAFGGRYVKKESSIREYTRPETRKALVARV